MFNGLQYHSLAFSFLCLYIPAVDIPKQLRTSCWDRAEFKMSYASTGFLSAEAGPSRQSVLLPVSSDSGNPTDSQTDPGRPAHGIPYPTSTQASPSTPSPLGPAQQALRTPQRRTAHRRVIAIVLAGRACLRDSSALGNPKVLDLGIFMRCRWISGMSSLLLRSIGAQRRRMGKVMSGIAGEALHRS